MALGDLLINISANTARFERDLGRAARIAKKKADKIKGNIISATRSIAQFGGGALASSGGLLVLTERAVASTDALAKQAKQSNLTAEALQEFRFVAERGGASARLLDDGVSRLNKRFGQAVAGGGPALKMFKQLNIELFDAEGNVRNTEAVLDDVVDRLGRLGSQAERSAAASALFGVDAGQKLANALGIGGDAVRMLREEKRKLGIISNETAAKSEEVADALTNVREKAGTALQNALLNNQGLLLKLANAFSTVVDRVSTASAELDRFLDKLKDPAAASPAIQQISNSLAEVEGQIKQTQERMRGFAEYSPDYARLQGQLDGLKKRQADLLAAYIAEGKAREKNVGQIRTQTEATGELNEETQTAIDNLEDLPKPLTLVADEADKAGKKVKTLEEKLDELLDRLDPTRARAKALADELITLNLAASKGIISKQELADRTKQLTKEFWDAEKGAAALKTEVKKTKEQMDPMTKAFERAIERIDDAFVDLWESALGGGLSNFADQAVATVRRMMAEIIQATARRVLINIGLLAPGASVAAGASGLAGAAGGVGLLGAAGAISPLLFSSGVTGASVIPGTIFPALTGTAPTGLLSGFAGFSGGVGSGLSGLGGALTGANGVLGFLGAAGAIVGVISLLSNIFGSKPKPRISAVTNLNSANPDPNGINATSPFSFNGTNLLIAAQEVTETAGFDQARGVVNALRDTDQVIFDLLTAAGLDNQIAAIGRGFVTNPDGSLRENRATFRGDFTEEDIVEGRIKEIISFLEGSFGNAVRGLSFNGAEEGVQAIQAMTELFDAIGADTNLIARYQEAIALGPVSAIEQIQEAGERLRNATVPRTIADTQALTAATQQYSQQVLQFVAGLDQIKANIGGITQQTTGSIRFQLLDRQGQIQFLDSQIKELVSGIQGNTDAEDIQRRISEANRLSLQLFGLLDPEEQQRRGEGIATYLERYDAIAKEEIDSLRQTAIDEAEATYAAQRELFKTEVVAPMSGAVGDFADWINFALENWPTTVRVQQATPTDREAAPA